MLWIAGLQAKTADGDEARYMASSAAYLRYYASALRSAREHAPSLLPVLVVLNDMPAAYTAWVEAQGALVIRHELTFASRMQSISDPHLRDNLMNQLMASYARLDIPAIMEKVEAALPAYEERWRQLGGSIATSALRTGVELDKVLWTDPDVLFRRDIDSCSLPMPHVLSIGPEMRPNTVMNCGVMLFNVKAYAEVLPAMLDFADHRNWLFVHDQELVNLFFAADVGAQFRKSWHRLTALPDAFNYKVYWGEPKPGWMAAFPEQVQDVFIVHTHGPKPQVALCGIEYLGQIVKQRLRWNPRNVFHLKPGMIEHCGMQDAVFLNAVLQVIAGAFKADNGAMYRWVIQEQERLCPGMCWEAQSSTEAAQSANAS